MPDADALVEKYLLIGGDTPDGRMPGSGLDYAVLFHWRPGGDAGLSFGEHGKRKACNGVEMM